MVGCRRTSVVGLVVSPAQQEVAGRLWQEGQRDELQKSRYTTEAQQPHPAVLAPQQLSAEQPSRYWDTILSGTNGYGCDMKSKQTNKLVCFT